jgi:hypothetical protein
VRVSKKSKKGWKVMMMIKEQHIAVVIIAAMFSDVNLGNEKLFFFSSSFFTFSLSINIKSKYDAIKKSLDGVENL